MSHIPWYYKILLRSVDPSAKAIVLKQSVTKFNVLDSIVRKDLFVCLFGVNRPT